MLSKNIYLILFLVTNIIFTTCAATTSSISCADSKDWQCLLENATQKANDIIEPAHRELLLASIAATYAQLGEHKKALALIEKTDDEVRLGNQFVQASVLGDAALVQGLSNNDYEAKQLSDKASILARSVPSMYERATLLIGIAINQIEIGHLEGAGLNINEIGRYAHGARENQGRAVLSASLAWLHAKMKNIEAAKVEIKSLTKELEIIPTGVPSAAALAYLAAAESLVGESDNAQQHLSRAHKIANAIKHPQDQVSALTIVLDARLEMNTYDRNSGTKLDRDAYALIEKSDKLGNADMSIFALSVGARALAALDAN